MEMLSGVYISDCAVRYVAVDCISNSKNDRKSEGNYVANNYELSSQWIKYSLTLAHLHA
jgi:hypothetical protein